MIYIKKNKTIHTFFTCFIFFQGHHILCVVGGQSWAYYIGSKRGKLQACPHRPVLHPFPWRWRGMENPLLLNSFVQWVRSSSPDGVVGPVGHGVSDDTMHYGGQYYFVAHTIPTIVSNAHDIVCRGPVRVDRSCWANSTMIYSTVIVIIGAWSWYCA